MIANPPIPESALGGSKELCCFWIYQNRIFTYFLLEMLLCVVLTLTFVLLSELATNVSKKSKETVAVIKDSYIITETNNESNCYLAYINVCYMMNHTIQCNYICAMKNCNLTYVQNILHAIYANNSSIIIYYGNCDTTEIHLQAKTCHVDYVDPTAVEILAYIFAGLTCLHVIVFFGYMCFA